MSDEEQKAEPILSKRTLAEMEAGKRAIAAHGARHAARELAEAPPPELPAPGEVVMARNPKLSKKGQSNPTE